MHTPGLPRVIEGGDGYRLIRFPIWMTEKMIREACDNVRRDAEVQGRTLRFTIGHRLVRFEGDVKEEE
jgi:hypothetical protein